MGSESLLYVWGVDSDGLKKEWLNKDNQSFQSMHGIAESREKVSLIDCKMIKPFFFKPDSGISGIRGIGFSPKHVVFGDECISHDEKTIREVSLVTDDTNILFHDLEVFGVINNKYASDESLKLLVKLIFELKAVNEEKRNAGPRPVVLYYTGKNQIPEEDDLSWRDRAEILEADTLLGKISVLRNTTLGNSGPCGAEIKNTVSVNIRFEDAVVFKEAFRGASKILRFIEILAGRPQNIFEFLIYKESSHQEPPVRLQVYEARPKYDRSADKEESQNLSFDFIINAGRNPEEFSRVLESWLNRDEPWKDARTRFSDCFGKQNFYDTDRLVAAANTFDLLPNKAFPAEKEHPENIKNAYKKSKKIFSELPESPERDRFLDALGRACGVTLKKKVRHRAQLVVDKIGDKIPEIFTVTDEAVNWRHYYVHGGSKRVRIDDYEQEKDIKIFLTDTLEFIFAVSDLVEAGWNIKAWTRSMFFTHPFSLYMRNYRENLGKLKSHLP